jgi:hypothetical protein
MKSKILYRISLWYGIVCLVFSMIAIPGLIVLYGDQGISSADLIHFISINTFFQNLIGFANMAEGIFYNALIILVSFSLIKGKMTMNRVTDVAVGVISIAAFLAAVNVIVGVFLFFFIHLFQESLIVMYQFEAFSQPIVPIASFIAVVLLTIMYVNQKLDVSPRKYAPVIFPLIALLSVSLHVIARFFHL